MPILTNGRCIAALLCVAATPATAALPEEVWRGGSTPAVAEGCDLRITSWNIERGQQLAAVTAALTAQAPTVALLQEVDIRAKRTKRVNVAEELSRKLNLNYLFAAEFEELGQGKHDAPAYHGQAVLTAWPVSAARFFRFQEQTDYWRPRWYLPNWPVFQRRTGGRLALVVELGSGPQKLVLYDVHLESRSEEDLRLRQMQEILTDARRYPEGTPVLIAGDFNTRKPSPPAVQVLLDAGYRKVAGGEITTTHGTALDWIFVRGPIEFSEGTVHHDVHASDHFPVTAHIRLRTPACARN
ncbi:MAG TPA: endonuclease/exonuclease/phosphatase family protein [Bryobacteraceae bacterium]|jgi:endonuclease/exonuclease/phosphatase family metal-dependent hydrolase|nr:endonuclease/exonuclease/phosphatase family protein [Bryobacteraceae bacterium]